MSRPRSSVTSIVDVFFSVSAISESLNINNKKGWARIASQFRGRIGSLFRDRIESLFGGDSGRFPGRIGSLFERN